MVCSPVAHAQQPVLQRGYDAAVSGATLTETVLNTSNVAPSTFGLVFKLPVDDRVYAQPLYVPGVPIAGQGTHNVVYVATMSDSLYAFDADTGAQLWATNFAALLDTTAVPIANFTFNNNQNIYGNLGILSTPVIDPSNDLMYLVACTLENGTLAYRLHAVDITTGAEPLGPGVLLSGSYGGSTFNARFQTQRVSLALSDNQVVLGFGAVQLEFAGGYVGWVMAYDKQTLQQSGIFATITTGSRGGGVWQSGRPPVVDSGGFVYVFVGNGYQNGSQFGYDGINDFSESALKLDPANSLELVDWFTPNNWSTLDNQDLDLSSSGPLLLADTNPNLLAGGGKAGVLYVLNTTNLGQYNVADKGVIQEESISNLMGNESSLRGGPVYWQRSAANGGSVLYNWSTSDVVKSFLFNGTAAFAATPISQGSTSQRYPGGILALSANGDQPASGLLWATVVASGNAVSDPADPGILYVYDALNLSTPLWSSVVNSARDNFGTFAKFVPPLVVNGKVYVATFSNQVVAYGLLVAATPTFSPMPGFYAGAQSVTLADTTPGASIFYTTDGTMPSNASTPYVSGNPLSISATTKVQAIAVASGYGNSAVASGIYTFSPSFSLSAAPGRQTVVTGNSTSYTVNIGAVSGFSGVVMLSASGLPAGASASFSPSTVSGSGGSTLTVSTSATTPVASSPLTITGTSGALTQSVGVTLTVNALPPPPGFTLTATPGTRTVVAGNSTSYTMNIGAVNGFSGGVTLSASGLPAGASASFSPSTVTGSGSATLTVSTSATTPAASSTLTITGSSGALTQSAGVTLSVTVTAAAAIGIKFVGQGTAMGSSEVAGIVAQPNWNNAAGTSSTAALALVNGGGASSGASVTWTSNGIYKLAIADTAGNNRMMRGYLDAVAATTTVKVTGLPANAAGYTVYVYADGANSGTRTGAYQISGTGITTTSVNLTDAANTDFSGTFTQANNSNGNYVAFAITATGFTITATPGAASDGLSRAPLNAIQIVPQTPVAPGFTLTASPGTQTVAAGNSASYTLNIGAVGGFSGVVTLSASGLPAGASASFSPATVTGSGSSTLTVTTSAATPTASSPLTITGTSGALTQNAGVALTVNAPPPPGFTLTATPGTQTVVAGNSASYTLNIGAVGGFSGVVTLSASGLPAGASASFSPATVTGSGSSTLTVTTSAATPVASSPLTITGTSGALTQSVGVTLTVNALPPPPGFTLTATPGTQTVVIGNTTSYAVNIGAVSGFSGVVTLSASGLPAGASASFSPATVTGSGSSTLTVTTSAATSAASSTLTITGTSGALTQSSGVTLSVTTATAAAAIGIKFVGQGTAMGSSEVAGIVAQPNWNNAGGTSSTAALALVNQGGASSGASVTWTSNGTYKLAIADTAGNNRMMRGYLDTVAAITTVAVAGLPANAAGYTVYVYADGANGGTRTGAYQISGTGITTTSVNLIDAANTDFSGAFTQANNSNGNYVAFAITATGFTITATPGTSSDAYSRAPLNAIQVIPR